MYVKVISMIRSCTFSLPLKMKQTGSLLLVLSAVSTAATVTQYGSSDGTRPSNTALLLVVVLLMVVDDTVYLYSVTQGDNDSVQEISTDELVKVSV